MAEITEKCIPLSPPSAATADCDCAGDALIGLNDYFSLRDDRDSGSGSDRGGAVPAVPSKKASAAAAVKYVINPVTGREITVGGATFHAMLRYGQYCYDAATNRLTVVQAPAVPATPAVSRRGRPRRGVPYTAPEVIPTGIHRQRRPSSPPTAVATATVVTPATLTARRRRAAAPSKADREHVPAPWGRQILRDSSLFRQLSRSGYVYHDDTQSWTTTDGADIADPLRVQRELYEKISGGGRTATAAAAAGRREPVVAPPAATVVAAPRRRGRPRKNPLMPVVTVV